MLDQYAQALKDRADNKVLRRLRSSRPTAPGILQINENGRDLVNFSSNDYLGLSQDPRLKARAIEYINKYGTGSGASRLLSGNLEPFDKIEAKLARLKGTEAALIFPSGFQTNSTVLAALLDKHSQVAADRLVHRSIIEGLQLSQARWFRFRHNDYGQLQSRFIMNTEDGKTASNSEPCDSVLAEQFLKNANSSSARINGSSQNNLSRINRDKHGGLGARWLVTESIFSMDGDTCEIEDLIACSEKLGLALYIDEAHATGVVGKDGMGLTAGLKFNGISMGTFGKGLGSFGAYICCSALLKEYLINFCSGMVYSTALPPPVLGAIDAALDLVPEMEAQRKQLQDNALYLREALKKSGFDTGLSTSHIIPIILGNEEAAMQLSKHLEEKGYCVPAVRPPTVQAGSSRLRLSLSSVHTRVQINGLLKILRSWHETAS